MFINRADYEALRIENATLSGENRALLERVTAQQATLDWLTVRVTQVERERAQLFERYTGVKIDVPEIVKTAPLTKKVDREFDFPVSFEDMGDERAGKLSIGWNDDGTLKA